VLRQNVDRQKLNAAGLASFAIPEKQQQLRICDSAQIGWERTSTHIVSSKLPPLARPQRHPDLAGDLVCEQVGTRMRRESSSEEFENATVMPPMQLVPGTRGIDEAQSN